jgi:hypothetical protein
VTAVEFKKKDKRQTKKQKKEEQEKTKLRKKIIAIPIVRMSAVDGQNKR